MNSNLTKLEYTKVIEKLYTNCKTYIGKELCQNLNPSSNPEVVKHNLCQTTQTYNLLLRYGNAPLDEFENLTPYIKNLESYIPLSTKGLLQIAKILNTSNNLKTYFSQALENSNTTKNNNEICEFNELEEDFEILYTNPSIYHNITKSILDENTISDDASKTLSTLRRNRRKFEYEIKEKLNNFIHSSTYSKYIMEPIITIRSDRYVIPVKIEHKENINGLVHDISASGSTVYIEPTSVFDLNNKINNIKLEENIEIEKILEELSKDLYPIIDNLKININAIGKIDFLFAKAIYSKQINGTEPIINTKKFINLIQARHPLINENTVVPIDISIGTNYKSLLITGPNTGGKTVTLKTVGLLCLMAQSGLHIPAKENSSLYVFDNIFADIGDEQSIQESLSTFSSHIVNIVDIINKSTSNSLVLIDELGSGTDPIQGANLAISILEDFYKKDCLTISTTHYAELKQYALVTDGFENASSEFDIENLKPTYKILIGIPGKSNAFAISKKLGLPSNILERAENLMTEDNISIEELLKNIYDDKLEIEKEKDKIMKNSNQIEMLRKQLENKNFDVEAKRNEIINKAKNEARNILLSAKEEVNDIIKELNDLYESANKDALSKANSLRDTLNSDIKNSLLTSENNSTLNNNLTLKIENISIGMKVLAKPFNMIGTVLGIQNKSGEVIVQLGNTKTNIKIENLEIIDISNNSPNNSSSILLNNLNRKPKHIPISNSKDNATSLSKYNKEQFSNYKNTSYTSTTNLKSKSISTEINVIGQTVDEAIFVIDKYLDDAYLSNIDSVRIVHGKGTGKLREGIHTFLKKHPHVKDFRLGTFGEGEMGVTIVNLKK